MSELGPEAAAPGRPSTDQAFTQKLKEEATRRKRSRNIGALRRLAPYVRDHWGDLVWALVFLLLSTGSTLGMLGAIRLVVDHLTSPDVDPSGIDRWFLLIGVVAITLALTTALRFFYISKLG